MSATPNSRFSNIAISLHWLMAFLIIGLLVMGKLMVQMDEASPLRFTLIQWHKTFGVLVLLLAVFRLLWRLTHKPPAHPAQAPAWERFSASASHVLFYLLIFIAPVTGWMLVSVSPLNIDTLLFNVFPWPHIPWLHNLADKAAAVHWYENVHEIATGVLIALLLVHVGAALKHHFVNKDSVMSRMALSRQHGSLKTFFALLFGLLLAIAASVLAYAAFQPKTQSFAAGGSQVMATAMIMGEATQIRFAESTVTAQLNPDNPGQSSITASVTTGSADTSNFQVKGSLPDAEWFDSSQHPLATFESSVISAETDGQFTVTGTLTIKGIAIEHTFTMSIEQPDTGPQLAKGEFTVDRSQYNLGLQSQASGDYVEHEVIIAFEFELM